MTTNGFTSVDNSVEGALIGRSSREMTGRSSGDRRWQSAGIRHPEAHYAPQERGGLPPRVRGTVVIAGARTAGRGKRRRREMPAGGETEMAPGAGTG